jgi:hypothetical protein
MKLLPTFKSVKALALATATVATTLVGNIAPSTATLANRVISAPGKPEVVIFESNLHMTVQSIDICKFTQLS